MRGETCLDVTFIFRWSRDSARFCPANQGRVITNFTPAWLGIVQFKARSDSLPHASRTVTVTIPYFLIGLCAFGSLLGGLVAFWAEQAAAWQRIVIGLVTGFVLYSAFLFGAVHTPNFPNGLMVNPLSAVTFHYWRLGQHEGDHINFETGGLGL